MPTPGIEARKADHIDLAASGRADFRDQGTLLAGLRLHHQSLPELALGEIDLSTALLGKVLRAPIVITGMTGGTPEARAINRDLAQAAQALGLAFGLGSQRAMAEKPEHTATYEVRDLAPDILLIGNIGAVQARSYGAARVAALADAIGADALAVHLNPAQEMMQADGDRDFRGIVSFLRELSTGLHLPLVVKETGCGLSPAAAASLASIGIGTVDVSGAGGTSWVAVERHRAEDATRERRLGDEYWDWGMPTAVSTYACARAGLQVIASGGIRTGLDIANAIALGATAGGLAAPVLRAQRAGGSAGAQDFLQALIDSLRTVHLLTGSRTPAELARAPRHLSRELREWIDGLG